MTKTLTLLLLLLVASPLWAATQPSVQVRTTAVTKQKLKETITVYGAVRPDPESLTTQDAVYSAFVQRLYVSLGQSVKKGDRLIELRTAPSARAGYLNALANLRYARQELARTRKLLKQHLATHADVNSAQQALQTAQANFAAQKELGTDQKTTTIKAPFTGIVSQLPIKPGNQIQVGTPLFQLAKRDRLQVALGVEPDEVSRVRTGMPVSVVSLFSDRNRVDSSVSQVNAVLDPTTRLVDIIVRLEGDQAALFLPGMQVKGLLTLATNDTLTVPRTAVLHDNKGDYLFIVRDRKAHRVNVQSGLENDGLIGVSGGLTVGDTVVVEGNYELTDGMAVRQAS